MKRFPPYSLRKSTKTKSKMSQLKNPVCVPISTPVVTTTLLSQTPTTINDILTPSTSQNLSHVPSSQPETNFPSLPALDSSLNSPVQSTQSQASVLETFQPDTILIENPQHFSVSSSVATSILRDFDPQRNVQISRSITQFAPSSLYLEPLPATTAGTSPIFSVPQSLHEPLVTTVSNYGMNSTGVGVETWAQNLTSPPISRSNQPQINPFTQAASQYPQPLFSDNFDPQFRSSNVSLPSFWDSNVELWFATVEHAFSANRIFDEHKRFSLVLSALDLKYIQKIQHVVRSPTTHPYQDIKSALIKACKLNENDRLDILFNRTELGDRKPSEMLSHMRLLLEAYDVNNTQTNAVLRKLFLDKLPTQACTVLAVSLESDLDALALRADEVVAALCQTSTQSHTSSQQQLINEIFDQKLNKIIETLQMPAARIQQPSSQYEFKPNAYSSRPTFNRKSNYRYEQSYRPTQNYRPQQPYWPKQNYRPTYQNNYQLQNFPKNLQVRHRGSAVSKRS